MNGAQLHLALNHIPVILSMAALAILLWGWLSKSYEIKKVGLVLAMVTAVFAGTAFLTGEPAEDVIEDLPAFSKELVHEHEEAGEAVLIVSIVAGLAAAATAFLIKIKHPLSIYVFAITTLLILACTLAFLRTAHLGGLIQHPEIRSESTH